ncbi:MAG: galactonate dehydratase [Clostridia bacterium]|nr:galactonate dehydratase [Oscillospiraceae bacterium]MBQ4624544.1 galactonate dehydratase [Clostridia bacterium]MBR6763993.1 galactonate dehydratase [Clostridia bacterium]
MKITDIKNFHSTRNHYVVVETDEGITGVGEASLHTRELAVEGAVLGIRDYLIGKDPMRIEHLWQDVFRGTFWRGGPVLQAALSGIDIALWDIKGKALNTPVYNLLGGKCRDKLLVYLGIGGDTPEEVAENGIKAVEMGYKALRFCTIGEAKAPYCEPGVEVRKSEKCMKALREAVGDDIEIVFECHTRLSPPRAIELCNRIADYHPFFVEDPLRADSPEMYRVVRQHTNVPLGTGEKFGAKWDYKCLIEEDLIDYLRTDICNCGGITEMRKIAAYGETHYMEMVPHGVEHVGFLASMHVDFAVPNFICQEDWLSRKHPSWLDYDVTFKDGYLTMGDRPGLGIDIDFDALEPIYTYEHPHWRRADGTVQDW